MHCLCVSASVRVRRGWLAAAEGGRKSVGRVWQCVDAVRRRVLVVLLRLVVVVVVFVVFVHLRLGAANDALRSARVTNNYVWGNKPNMRPRAFPRARSSHLYYMGL